MPQLPLADLFIYLLVGRPAASYLAKLFRTQPKTCPPIAGRRVCAAIIQIALADAMHHEIETLRYKWHRVNLRRDCSRPNQFTDLQKKVTIKTGRIVSPHDV
jgi:hypothetical protein